MLIRLQELCKTCKSLVGRSVIIFYFITNGRTALKRTLQWLKQLTKMTAVENTYKEHIGEKFC